MKKSILVILVICLVLFVPFAFAVDITLEWDASIDAPYIDGYRVYKTEVQGEYITVTDNPTENSMIWEGTGLTAAITVPDGEYRCWFVVTAYNRLESDYSNEAKYSTKTPGPPANLRGENPNMCKGDFDFDGDIDGTDMALFALDYGRTDCGGKVDR